jgi:dienelactone hydrolase
MINRRQCLILAGFAGSGLLTGKVNFSNSTSTEIPMSIPTQEMRRKELYRLLGDVPDRQRPIKVLQHSQEEKPAYILEKLVLDLNGFEPVPAYFVRPKEMKGRIPAILYNHAHGGEYDLGKDELIKGRSLLQQPPYAEVLTSMGYCALCIDTWVFGERAKRSELDTFKEMLWKGQVLWGMMVYDNLRALDYLISRPEVDSSRLGTLGLSMGSTMAWWCAALDPRIGVCIDICCLTDFDALIASHGLKEHGIYYYVPSLLKHFTASQINALIAPRPHLGLAGNLDALTPVQGLDRIDRELKEVYRQAGSSENWKLLRYDVPHMEIPEMRKEIISFLQKHL